MALDYSFSNTIATIEQEKKKLFETRKVIFKNVFTFEMTIDIYLNLPHERARLYSLSKL